MTLVVAFDDLNPSQSKRRAATGMPGGVTTTFFRAPPGTDRAPTAIHAQYDPGSVSTAHFHTVDQFQIIIQGKGKFGRHDVAPYHVHFSRAYTPYGPLHADKESGWIFLTLRTRHDPGAQRLPGAQQKLIQTPDRHPWQITRKADFPAQGASGLQELPDIKDDHGLRSYALSVAPGKQFVTPDPSSGDGQYVVVVKGSLMYDGKEHKALTVVYIEPQESAFQVHAGPQGLEGLVLNFPKIVAQASDSKATSAAQGSSKHKCALCDFTYIAAAGMPEDGIAAGTRWEDIPETWTCPDCGAAKADFEMAKT